MQLTFPKWSCKLGFEKLWKGPKNMLRTCIYNGWELSYWKPKSNTFHNLTSIFGWRNSTCALCDALSILNKSCEMFNRIAASKFLWPKPTLKVRVFNDEEFASMNRIKLIACLNLPPTLICTVWSWLRQQLLHSSSSDWFGSSTSSP